MDPADWPLPHRRLQMGQRYLSIGRGCGGWRQEEVVLLEESHKQIMHRIVPIDGREDITRGHLLCEWQEGSHHRVQLLGKVRRKLLLKLEQQTGNNHPKKNLIRVRDLRAGLFDYAAQLLKDANGGLTAFQ